MGLGLGLGFFEEDLDLTVAGLVTSLSKTSTKWRISRVTCAYGWRIARWPAHVRWAALAPTSH